MKNLGDFISPVKLYQIKCQHSYQDYLYFYFYQAYRHIVCYLTDFYELSFIIVL